MVFVHVYCRAGNNTSQDSEVGSDMRVHATLDDFVDDGVIHYIAASPPDYRTSYTGSALPFASPQQAFQGTPNRGKVAVQGDSVVLNLLYPNSFYIGLGTVIVPPTLYLYYRVGGKNKEMAVKLSDGVPYRFLTYPMKFTQPRDGAHFYHGMHELPVRTQEQIFRDGGYPSTNKMAKNFWGLKPPV